MANAKPFVAAALVCEKVLVEKDGVLSAIRIVDSFKVNIPERLPPNTRPGLPLTVLITLKSGDVRGRSQLSAKVRHPDGKVIAVQEPWPILLNGDEHGVSLNISFGLPADKLGLYWFEVYWNGEHLTSIPIKLVAEPEGARQAGTS